MGHVIYIFDQTGGRYRYLSPNIGRITGHDPAVCLEHRFTDLLDQVHPDDRAGYSVMFARAAESGIGGRPSAIEYRRLMGDGGYRWFREYIVRIPAPEPDQVYVIGTAADITAQVVTATVHREGKQQCAELSKQFKAILDGVPDVIVFQSPDREIVWSNKAAAISLGMTNEELTGRHCFALWQKRELPCENCPVQTSLMSGKPAVAEVTSPDGRTWEIRSIPILSDSSTVTGVIEIARDISLRNSLEEERIKSAKLQSLGTLAGGIAHDFNNLLTGILGNIGLSKLYLDPKHDAHTMLTEAEQVAVRAKRLTSQFITFSEGGAPMKKPVAMAPFIREQISRAVTRPDVTVRCDIEGEIGICEIDEKQFEHVIRNLVSNALDAMGKNGVLTITASMVTVEDDYPAPILDGRYLRLSVTDDGHGIPEKHLPRVFDPYFTTKDIGHGLGLAVAYSVVRKHGGHIAATSRDGNGATFDIYIPSPGGHAGFAADIKPRHQGKVLLMDDEEVIRMATGRLLARHGYEVETAADGDSAVVLFRNAHNIGEPFDVVILDLTVIDGMGGKDALKSIRGIDPSVKAIVSSGYYNDPLMADYREHGFHGKSEKPYLINDLTRLIRQIMSGGGMDDGADGAG